MPVEGESVQLVPLPSPTGGAALTASCCTHSPLAQLLKPAAEASLLMEEATLLAVGTSQPAMLPSLTVELLTQPVAATTPPVVQPTSLAAVVPKLVAGAT